MHYALYTDSAPKFFDKFFRVSYLVDMSFQFADGFHFGHPVEYGPKRRAGLDAHIFKDITVYGR